MNTRSFSRAPLLAALGLFACDPDFDPGSQVSSLRVLAVQADRPYAAPGDTVRLQALSHDPLGRPVTWAWALCPSPAGSSVNDCLAQVLESASAGSIPLLALGEGEDRVELSIPADALDGIPAVGRPQALSGVLNIACPGELTFEASALGLPFRCTDASTGEELGLHDAIVGVKRVFLRETDVNRNPVIERVLFDGEDWPAGEVKEVDGCPSDDFDYSDCGGSDRHRLAAVLAPDSFEAGRDEFGRAFAEGVIVQHYATEGIFEHEVRIARDPETGWVARSSASGSEITLWFVVRDDRGGVSWTERRVRVR